MAVIGQEGIGITEAERSFCRVMVIIAGFYSGNSKPTIVLRTLHVSSGV